MQTRAAVAPTATPGSSSFRFPERQKNNSGFHGRFAVLAELHNLVEDALGYFPLRGFRDFNNLITRDDGDRVAVRVKADAFARYVVDDDRVEMLAYQLLAGVL